MNSKIVKKIIFIIATLIFVVLISSLGNKCFAVSKGTSEVEGMYNYYNYPDYTVSYPYEKYGKKITEVKPNHKYPLSGYFLTKNKFTFCVQNSQKVSFEKPKPYYTTSELITIDGSTSNKVNGLAYILNQDDTSRPIKGNAANTVINFHNSEVQLALWYYIQTYPDYVPNGFGPCQDLGEYNNSYLKNICKCHSWGGDNNYGRKAYQIFKAAQNIANSGSDTIYKAKIYFLTPEPGKTNQKLMLVESTEEEPNPEIELDFYKIDLKGTNLSGAKISVEGSENVNEISRSLYASQKGSGDMGKVTLKPITNTGTVKITVKETTTPDNCEGLPYNGVTLTINYNTTTGEVNSINGDSSYVATSNTNGVGIIKIKNKQIPPINLTIRKTDTAGNPVQGIRFLLNEGGTFIYDDYKKYIWATNYNGMIEFPEIERDSISNFYVNIYEETAITDWLEGLLNISLNKTIPGFVGLKNPIRIDFEYVNGTWKAICNDNRITTKIIDNTVNIEYTVKNQVKIDKLKILKVNSQNSNIKLSGARFNVELTNIKDYSSGTFTTNDSGELELTDLVIKNPNQPIIATITEISAPAGFKGLDGSIVIELERKGNSLVIKSVNKDGNIVEVQKDETNYTVTLTIKNTPTINLSGKVWLDGQQGEKNVEPPNGLKNPNEKGIKGVKVHLYSNKDGEIIATTTTSADGTYNFSDVTKTEEGYKVYFEYNGIIYDDVGITQDSKAAEVNTERDTLNGKFKIIDKIGAKDENGTRTIKYGEHNASYFKNYVDGSQPEGAAIKAYTSETYRETTENIDCGLLEKYFDLAAGTDVSYAEVSINGEKTKYNYAQVYNGELEELKPFEGTSSDKTEYTLYLYKSDYNYRIEDYKPDSISNKVNPEDNNVNPKEYDNLQNLEVYVTYSVDLINQSYHNATVTKFEYVYDEAFEPYNIPRTDKYEVDLDTNNRKITFTSIRDGLSVNEPDYRNQIDLTFKVKKNTEGNLILEDGFRNTVEILEYSTNEGGLIDDDSVPGNGIDNKEDDWDEAPTFNIKVKEEARTIEGTVFEDANKNGDNDDKTPVNDVIVQLIELKTIKGKYYEYIWQETKSGSNTVRTTEKNGYKGNNYNNKVTENGKYKFKDFIPGNYIIRFIYGDGSTYDITTDEYKNSADNVKKYNGQDYKSTIDSKYNEEWYNQANYNEKSSVARDNEARRLEVMEYSTTINNDIGEKINKKEINMLDATWMCAETSKVNVKVDVEGYSNMNFGLALRPQTKLKLEKHITGLKITPQGTGVQPIVDAKISKDQILNNLLNTNEITIEGMRTNLSAIKSNRNEKGFWKVETDIEELAQGAKLEIEFNYVVINESEEDYLSNALVDDYKTAQDTNNMKYYNYKLEVYKTEIKGAMKDGTYSYSNNNIIGRYLGQFYYNGRVNEENEKAVPSAVSSIEDIINTDFKLSGIESENCFEQESETPVKNKYNADKKLEKAEKIATIKNKNGKATKTIIKDKNATEENKYTSKNTDYSLIAKLETTLSSANKEIYYSDGLAQIMQYTNAAGRKDMEATPGNLKYVGSDAKELTLDSYVKYAENGDIIDVSNEPMEGYAKLNEDDEYWGGTGETLIVSKPTGEDKQTSMQIVIIAISSIAVIGVGIILVKKFVLKK